MSNPINNTVFDSRDLIEYKTELEEELVALYNEWMRDNLQDGYTFEDITDFSEIENWDSFAEYHDDETEEYIKIKTFCEDIDEHAGDSCEDGVQIIHHNYFDEYTRELLEDCGYISKDFPSWIEIDWSKTAENVAQDYSIVTYENQDYYVR
jgi:hypothetical protein